jgi:hypothetical protein
VQTWKNDPKVTGATQVYLIKDGDASTFKILDEAPRQPQQVPELLSVMRSLVPSERNRCPLINNPINPSFRRPQFGVMTLVLMLAAVNE